MKRIRTAAGLGVALAAAWLIACGDDAPEAAEPGAETPPVTTQEAGRPPQATAPDASSDARAADAEAEAEAAAPEGGPDASDAGDADAPVYEDPPTCPPVITLGTPEALNVSTAAADVGLSVTPDGLTAAWTTEELGVVTVHYADRATMADPFGAAQSISGAFAPGRVALAASGLGLAVVNADGLGLTWFPRAARTDPFGAGEVGPFSGFPDFVTAELAPGDRLANPMFARDDGFLLFTRVTADGNITYVTTRFDLAGPFAGGAKFVDTVFGIEPGVGIPGARRVVTGASADLRTLFVWDETASKTRVIHLTAQNTLDTDVELGDMRDVGTTANCKTFYFTAGGDLQRAAAP